jgi:preprotein translocase subunit SecA
MKRTPAESTVRNEIGWRQRLSRLRGDAVRFDLRAYDAPLAEINTLEERLRKCRDSELAAFGAEIRAAAAAALPRQSVRPRAYALVREAARRTLGLRPFDVQIVAALAMDDGAVVEMQTGEGKTLAAVMPAALNALTGRGVHVLTFNDYLAERDAAWMGPVYGALGLTARHVHQGMTPAARREAYAAAVTYVTAKEAGFDHLRDLLAVDPRDIVHRPLHFAILDEADSLMIDEARAPLVIAGSVDRIDSSAASLAALVRSLERGVHFDTDEYERDVELTDDGAAHVEKALGCGNLHDEKNYRLLTGLNCALHARVLLRRDVDYIVRSGRIELVDEFTGRVVDDRHWPDGLQAALEAKEGIGRSSDGCVLDSLTLQHFLRGYPRVCGMTGTARDAAWELQQTYGVEVVVIPTNRPAIRIDHPDVVFTHREAKERAVVDEIRRAATSGRPVLVGTFTIEESERLAAQVRSVGLACEVLNAHNDAAEARIVAKAGAPGAITIATNMAGRGTDVRLGGEDEAEHDRVAALGGLYVIGTNRHESHRVDLQLRGRAGRQGDPGESRFFLSLDDDLMVKFGVRNLIPERFLPPRSDAPIENPVVRREIARTQRIIEGQNIEIRRTLGRYAGVNERQHTLVMERRTGLLSGAAAPDVWRASGKHAALVAAAGTGAVEAAERAVTLHHIDRAWREHLAFCADLREGIHLVRLGGHDPLTRFSEEAIRSFASFDEEVDAAVLADLEHVSLNGGSIELTRIGIKGPSSTWTYLVNDDPFRNQIGAMLTGPGSRTVATYSAAVMMPLLIAWALVERLVGRRARRR